MNFIKSYKTIATAGILLVGSILLYVFSTLQRINNDSRTITVEELANNNFKLLTDSAEEIYPDIYKIEGSSVQRTEVGGEYMFTGLYSSRSGGEKEFSISEKFLSDKSEHLSKVSLLVILGIFVIVFMFFIGSRVYRLLESDANTAKH